MFNIYLHWCLQWFIVRTWAVAKCLAEGEWGGEILPPGPAPILCRQSHGTNCPQCSAEPFSSCQSLTHLLPCTGATLGTAAGSAHSAGSPQPGILDMGERWERNYLCRVGEEKRLGKGIGEIKKIIEWRDHQEKRGEKAKDTERKEKRAGKHRREISSSLLKVEQGSQLSCLGALPRLWEGNGSRLDLLGAQGGWHIPGSASALQRFLCLFFFFFNFASLLVPLWPQLAL